MRLLALVAIAALTSCGRECTLIGCVDTIDFVFAESQLAQVVDGATVRVCVADACLDHTIGTTAQFDTGTRTLQVFQGEPTGLRGTVTLTVGSLRREWTDVPFSAFEPNGPMCGPVCHAAGPLTVE